MVSHPEESGPGLFVYGTLMDEEILKLLIGRVPKMSDATVTGFR